MRRFHRDLGSGYDQIPRIQWQLGQQHPERIEDRDRNNGGQGQQHGCRYRNPQKAHHSAVASSGREARFEAFLESWSLD
jgi:hypothetical protein